MSKTSLLLWGIEPMSVMQMAFGAHVLRTELSCPSFHCLLCTVLLSMTHLSLCSSCFNLQWSWTWATKHPWGRSWCISVTRGPSSATMDWARTMQWLYVGCLAITLAHICPAASSAQCKHKLASPTSAVTEGRTTSWNVLTTSAPPALHTNTRPSSAVMSLSAKRVSWDHCKLVMRYIRQPLEGSVVVFSFVLWTHHNCNWLRSLCFLSACLFLSLPLLCSLYRHHPPPPCIPPSSLSLSLHSPSLPPLSSPRPLSLHQCS